ncbi:MAG TPA: hypothetical protein VG295_05075 [Solirubrobacteraceae bacterium]|jgi:hypothetical protein|nr:hypothetical protein [Solirubrobacteraceae bacterium]
MKRFIIALSCLLALGAASGALAAGTLSGTYRTKIHTSALGGAVNGTWTLAFKSGAYTVTDNGAVVIHGRYTITGDKITLRDKSGKDACPGSGTYKFALTANKLKFTRVRDPKPACVGRVTVLAGKFTKVA